MSLSIGPATDYLVTKATAAVTGITVNGKPVQVVDGWPNTMAYGMFVIGLDRPPTDSVGEIDGTRSWGTIAGNEHSQVAEDYTIPCYIDVRTSGSQKDARDTAAAVFDAFWPLLRADLTFGGVLSPGAEITGVRHMPTSVGTAAERGHRHRISFSVRCLNFTL